MHPTMQWHIPEDQNSQVHHCENLKNSFRSFTFARVGYGFKVAATHNFCSDKILDFYMNIQYMELQFCLIFYMGVNTGLSNYGKSCSVRVTTLLRKIPVPKREEITEGCRQLSKKERHDLYHVDLC
jgi:hypothetical protein